LTNTVFKDLTSLDQERTRNIKWYIPKYIKHSSFSPAIEKTCIQRELNKHRIWFRNWSEIYSRFNKSKHQLTVSTKASKFIMDLPVLRCIELLVQVKEIKSDHWKRQNFQEFALAIYIHTVPYGEIERHGIIQEINPSYTIHCLHTSKQETFGCPHHKHIITDWIRNGI